MQNLRFDCWPMSESGQSRHFERGVILTASPPRADMICSSHHYVISFNGSTRCGPGPSGPEIVAYASRSIPTHFIGPRTHPGPQRAHPPSDPPRHRLPGLGQFHSDGIEKPSAPKRNCPEGPRE